MTEPEEGSDEKFRSLSEAWNMSDLNGVYSMHNADPPTEVKSTMEAQVVLKAIPGGQSDNYTWESDVKNIALVDRKRAYNDLVQKFKRPLFFHALYMLRNEEEAKDIVQETFLRAYEEERLFDPDFLIKAWLYRVTTNLCHNILRSSKRKQRVVDLFMREEEPLGNSSDELLSWEEDKEKLLLALDKLPKKDKTILLLKYYNNLSYKEISSTLNCKLGTVMSRLGRARERLSRSVNNEL